MMYYGGIGQAVFGSIVIILSLVYFVILTYYGAETSPFEAMFHS
jgi:hypothetical protein